MTTDAAQSRTAPRHHDFLSQSMGERLASIAWAIVWHTMFRFSPPPLSVWRRFLLRLFGATIDSTGYIAPSVRVHFPWNLAIGPHTQIQPGVILNCMGTIKIGQGVLISRYAHLCAGTHDYHRTDMEIKRCPITVGSDVWIAADAFVGPGVTLGDGCLLAARSSAFRDLPGGMVCIGEPAEARHERFEGEEESH